MMEEPERQQTFHSVLCQSSIFVFRSLWNTAPLLDLPISSPRFTESIWLTGQLLRLQHKSSGKIKAIHLRTSQQTLTIKASKYFRLEPGYCPVVQDWIQLKVLKSFKSNGTKLKAFEMLSASEANVSTQCVGDIAKPPTLAICHGSACRKRGSEKLLKGIAAQSSEDQPILLETCPCLGQCKAGPAIQLDGQILAPMTLSSLLPLLQTLESVW